MSNRLLEGRTALVTGASRGIGAACALALGHSGASVVVNYLRNEQAASDVVQLIEAEGSKTVAVQGDVCDPEGAIHVADQAAAMLGDIDILVCNAAGPGAVTHGSTIESAAQIEERVRTQLRATLQMCRLVVPGMRERGAGSIVFIGSTESRSSAPAIPEIAIAKAAQDALMRSLAAEVGPYGIRVNTIAPGLVPTDGSAEAMRPELVAAIESNTALRRLAQPGDVGDAVVAFASDLTRHITGAYVPVDGGQASH
ncbi:SDR family NAD(P)-dependent oxidoreductase [Streptomyces syringium]|uniref:SDR family NAD(P)-dependent oxidoreductase n=1 Tax=Streptomyces syringium TaxID=76729 RepID=UPI0033DEBB53